MRALAGLFGARQGALKREHEQNKQPLRVTVKSSDVLMAACADYVVSVDAPDWSRISVTNVPGHYQ